MSEEEVIELLNEIFYKKYSNSTIKEYLLNCLLKLSVKFHGSKDRISQFIEEDTKSNFCEVQQRAVEYSIFTKIDNYSLKKDITRNTPNSKIVKEYEVKK